MLCKSAIMVFSMDSDTEHWGTLITLAFLYSQSPQDLAAIAYQNVPLASMNSCEYLCQVILQQPASFI